MERCNSTTVSNNIKHKSCMGTRSILDCHFPKERPRCGA